MPIYEFKCSECGHLFEELVLRASDTDEIECPECQARTVERVLSACSVGSDRGSRSTSCSPSSGFS